MATRSAKPASKTTIIPHKTPNINDRFISSVTDYQNNYGINGDTDNRHHQPKSPVLYALTYSDALSDTTPAIANFLKVYFDFVYFLLACPFRIGVDERGKFFVKKYRPQMVLCAVVQLMCFIRLFSELRVSIDKEYSCKTAGKNPVQYFNIIMDVSSLFYKMVTIKRFWLNQEDYLNVLLYIQGRTHLRVKPSSMQFFQTVFFLYTFFGCITTHAFASFLFGKNFIDQSSSWSISLWANQLVKLARFTFCFEETFNVADESLLATTTNVDIFITVLMSISLIARFIIGLYCDLFLLCHTITLWLAARSFAVSIQKDIRAFMRRERDAWGNVTLDNGHGHEGLQSSGHNFTKAVGFGDQSSSSVDGGEELAWVEVYGHFRVVQKLAMLINISLGNLITWYMTEAVMYYSVRLNKFLTSTDIFVRVDLAVFYFTTFGILFISADICSQMESVKGWISFGDNRKRVPADELSIVLHEMLAKDIGIRGSNVFTITYSLLAVFFSTIVTYFIICVQQGDSNSILSSGGGTGGNVTKCN